MLLVFLCLFSKQLVYRIENYSMVAAFLKNIISQKCQAFAHISFTNKIQKHIYYIFGLLMKVNARYADKPCLKAE